MGLFKGFPFRNKPKVHQELQAYPKKSVGNDWSSRLTPQLLQKVFSFVCPHAVDETYNTSEESLLGSGCLLCDLQDLRSCALVSCAWHEVASGLLYHTVRIDAVHFCPQELVLSEQRRRRNINPSDIPIKRLRLLESTLKSSSSLAPKVKLLKLNYTLRETARGELARLLTLLTNLRYVDLPEGFYKADSSTQILRSELQSSCPDIRKMTFSTGSEDFFETHASTKLWPNLQVIELDGLQVGFSAIRTVLGVFRALYDLRISNMPHLEDGLFEDSTQFAKFPSLSQLFLKDMPNVTSRGLLTYMTSPQTRELESLTIIDSGVLVEDIHSVLRNAPRLSHLAVTQDVRGSTRLDKVSLLSSTSLKTIDWEITSSEHTSPSHDRRIQPTDPYYRYLASSLQAQTLPRLRKVFVRDPSFPEMLLVPHHERVATEQQDAGIRGHRQALEIYAKGQHDLDWISSILPSNTTNFLADTGTPLGELINASSTADGDRGPNWRGEARKSIIVLDRFKGSQVLPIAS